MNGASVDTYMPVVRIQIVLYNLPLSSSHKLFGYLAKIRTPEGWDMELCTADNSPEALYDDSFVAEQAALLQGQGIRWTHATFPENPGFGAAHNRLFCQEPVPERVLLVNPDSYCPPDLLVKLCRFADAYPDFGMVEARQIPLEHPKEFEVETGRTNWCSGACVLINGTAFAAVSGFDERFFLYGEDVDLSWRIKGLDKSLYYCLDAWIYHAKNLGLEGIIPTESEMVFSTLATLIIYRKYGQRRSLKRFMAVLQSSIHMEHQRALQMFDEMRDKIPLADIRFRRVANFMPDGSFGRRRWEYIGATQARPDRSLVEEPQSVSRL